MHRDSPRGTVGDAQPPTFKWSWENGSVAARFLFIKGNEIQLAAPRGFAAEHRIEITDDADDLLARPGTMARLSRVEADRLTVEGSAPAAPTGAHPKVRRWDQRATSEVTLDNGAVPIITDKGQGGWIEVGIAHHYAPLFLFDGTGESPFVSLTEDCRNRFWPMLSLAE